MPLPDNESTRGGGGGGGARQGPPGGQARTHFNLPPPPQMNLKSGNLADNWHYFEEEWTNWATPTKLNGENPAIVLAALKHTNGHETVEILKNLQLANDADAKAVLDALRMHFIPKKNITYERHVCRMIELT